MSEGTATGQRRRRTWRGAVAGMVALLVLSGCQLAFDQRGDVSQIEWVAEVTEDGWKYEYFRNLAYECSLPNKPDGSTGYQTFVIGTRVGEPDTEVHPLWVRMRGGGAGWFDATGTARPGDANMREEGFTDVRNRLSQPGLGGRINEHPAGFRGLSVSMCNRDTYAGAGNDDPNNIDSDGNQRRTSGLVATKAAIEFTMQRHATSDFFLHGGSAGSVGTYHVAWSLQEQGTPPAGIVADGGIRNDGWEADRIAQGICTSPFGGPDMVEAFAPRGHSQLRGPEAQPHELVASGALTVPIAQVWSQGDPTSCGAIPMVCSLPGGAVTMGATDCKNEALRAAIAAEGPQSRSLSLGVCVTGATSIEPCDVHVSTRLDRPNTNPAYPEDYLGTLIDWVDDRLAETPEGVLGASLACPWNPADTRRHTFLVAGDDDAVATGADTAWLPTSLAAGDPRVAVFEGGTWQPLVPADGSGTFGPELSFAATLAAACPASNIGIVKWAQAGATMGTWTPGGANRTMLANRIAGAVSGGEALVFEGALLQQGTSDAATLAAATAWGDDFVAAISALRTSPVIPTDLPVLYVSERRDGYPDDVSAVDPAAMVGLLPGGPYQAHVLAEQWAAQDALDGLHLTIVRDAFRFDGPNQSTPGVRATGRALAEEYLVDVTGG